MIVSQRWASVYASIRSSVCAGETKRALQVAYRVCRCVCVHMVGWLTTGAEEHKNKMNRHVPYVLSC